MATRRDATDESMASIASSLAQNASITVQYLKAIDLEESSSDVILQRSLSVRSVISTSSSFAMRFQRATTDPALQAIREIGQGLQATIFEQIGHELVVKKEHPEISQASTSKNLIKEFAAHQLVYDAFQRYASALECNISVPRPMTLITIRDDKNSQAIIEKLPQEFQTPSTMIQMDRVLPLPKLLNHQPNKDCLIRPYLGMPKKKYTQDRFSLRNFILDLPSLQNLGFDVQELATTLGRAYAIIQWGAHVDGDDIEFVLGSSITTGPDTNKGPSFQHRKVGLHLIDFGQCETIDMNCEPQVVYQAFKGAMVMGDNAYFIPNYRHTPLLFETFTDAYAQTAKVLIHHQGMTQKFSISEFMSQYKEYAEDFL